MREQVVTVFVSLINEGTEAWRPVDARQLGGGVYLIESHNPDPEDQHWQFSFGQTVRCTAMTFSDGKRDLVASSAFADTRIRERDGQA